MLLDQRRFPIRDVQDSINLFINDSVAFRWMTVRGNQCLETKFCYYSIVRFNAFSQSCEENYLLDHWASLHPRAPALSTGTTIVTLLRLNNYYYSVCYSSVLND